jgi:hypothetical protein
MARKIDNCLTVIEASSRDRSLTCAHVMERVTRIELALSAWEADVLPLNYTRTTGIRAAAALNRCMT